MTTIINNKGRKKKYRNDRGYLEREKLWEDIVKKYSAEDRLKIMEVLNRFYEYERHHYKGFKRLRPFILRAFNKEKLIIINFFNLISKSDALFYLYEEGYQEILNLKLRKVYYAEVH